MKLLIRVFYMLAITAMMVMCANPVSPTGGSKDTQPPGFEKAEPPLFTKNFTSNKIRIFFDEFVELKEINNQFIVSPPMQKMPEFKIKGKSVIIEFQEELMENTTYNMFFGSAIVDITESNPIGSFQYVFSTGDVLDSMSIEGYVYDAFNQKPVENANVMLYLDNNDTILYDSLPYIVKPYYMAKTDASGNFLINNLPDTSFKIFALIDLNSNLIYDQPLEQIAFLDSLITPLYVRPPEVDSLISDSLNTDTLFEESINTTELENNIYEMALFQEEDSIQKFIKAFVGKEAQLVFIFKRPAINPVIRPVDLNANESWSIIEPNKTNDTLFYWLTIQGYDSLRFEITESNVILDTVEMAIVKKERGKKRKSKKGKPKGLKVTIRPIGKIDLNKPLVLNFDYPLKSYDFSNIILIEKEDTLFPDIAFKDSIGRIAIIDHKWKESTEYKLIIPDSVFYNLLGRSHDSIISSFASKSLDNYGNLYLETIISDAGSNHIIQLLQKETIISEVMIANNQKIAFEYLTPGKYEIRVIYDQNNNGMWDTGDYYYNIQPEKTEYFPTEIDIRENWDIEETWKLSEKD